MPFNFRNIRFMGTKSERFLDNYLLLYLFILQVYFHILYFFSYCRDLTFFALRIVARILGNAASSGWRSGAIQNNKEKFGIGLLIAGTVVAGVAYSKSEVVPISNRRHLVLLSANEEVLFNFFLIWVFMCSYDKYIVVITSVHNYLSYFPPSFLF